MKQMKLFASTPWSPAFADNAPVAEGEQVALPEMNLPQKYTDDDFDAAAKSTAFLPRLQLMTSNSKQCKSGEFPVNNYALVDGQNFTDLGNPIDVLVITWRPKAMTITPEQIITNYDPASETFKNISLQSNEKDSGCMYGPEFLIWLPVQGKFATFFMGSKSARRESGQVKGKIQQAVTLGHQMIDGAKYSWACPQASDCSTPFDLPPADAVLEENEKFQNPAEELTEAATDEEQATTGRER